MKIRAIHTLLTAAFALVVVLAGTSMGNAQNIEDLKKGVVKITAHAEGKTKVGTGFIVRLEKETAYIVTASHVVEGDPQPKVVFRPNDTKVFPAHIKGLEGGDPRGLAALVVEGNLPEGLETLPLNQDFNVTGGEPGTVIGFPRVPAVPWAVTSSVMTGQQGKYLVFSGAAVEGNSGGPIMVAGKAVGVITEVLGQYGYAVPIQIMQIALRGWSIPLDAATKETARVPEIAEGQLPHEVTGKDSAPMVLIPAGEFHMGSPDGEGDQDEHPRHRVAFSAFYLDKYEVTNRFFQQFVQQTSYRTTAEQEGKAWALTAAGKGEEVSGAHWRKPEGGETVFDSNREEHPVVSVSWVDAQAYCRWAGKRLPTEAEFEYATRAGTETKYWWGNDNPGSRQVANIGDESMKRQYSNRAIMTGYDDGYVRTAPVGSFDANPFGLYDIIGNVWEWTADWYDEQYYKNTPRKSPKGPSKGDYRVIRGGSWNNEPGDMRSANRLRYSPSFRTANIGFRCAQDSPK